MKKKLKILFILITLALSGIIIFQIYWSFNAYQVNKNKFDAEIDIAMQKAMDGCKKDYFDSIRVVMVKRLSDTSNVKIKVDTIYQLENSFFINNPKKVDRLEILVADKHVNMGRPFSFSITVPILDFYRAKIPHKNATWPQLLVETSFYVPTLLNSLRNSFMIHDISTNVFSVTAIISKDKNGKKVIISKFNTFGMFELPPNYRASDSLKLSRYFRTELDKVHIPSPFRLQIADSSTRPQKLNMHYSQTSEHNYMYHGFVFLHGTNQQLFMRAVFSDPQYVIIKQMLITLGLSVLLIAFTIYCFLYIIHLVIHQKKLADLKDDFINNMTHELKTPIATITVAIEGLQNFNVLDNAEKTQRYLQTSRNELARLNELVTKVLNIAAFENKEIELNKETINVNDLINDVLQSENAKTSKIVNFSFINGDNIKQIYVDKLHFRNVFTNIVDNAVKYSNDPVSITITCFKQYNNAVFSIKDNGIGIPAGHLDLVFDKFHRVPAGNVHNVKGTGLGLSYVKYIVTAHGGDISVKSEINTGSEFIVSIPLNNG
jgi:signal transduction histidine kinase